MTVPVVPEALSFAVVRTFSSSSSLPTLSVSAFISPVTLPRIIAAPPMPPSSAHTRHMHSAFIKKPLCSFLGFGSFTGFSGGV